MKILFLINSLAAGGAERVTVNLSDFWVRQGWDVTVATLTGEQDDFYDMHPRVARISLGTARPSTGVLAALFNNLRSIMAVRRLLKKVKPDVALGVMTASNLHLAIGGLGLPGVRIGTEHSHPPRLKLGLIWEWLRRYGYRWLDAVVALTKRTEIWLVEETKAPLVCVIPNPVPWPLPSGSPERSPAELIVRGRRTLMAVGRLVDHKGFDLLILSFARIANSVPMWDLVIVGDGVNRQALEMQLDAAGLRERIHLAGRVGNVQDWYEAADLYVMSSRLEGFPNTLIEAMACGLPAVSYDCETGPADIIRDGIDGVLVPPGNVDALATALQTLMLDETSRLAMSQCAKEVRQRLSLTRVTSDWQALFNEIGIRVNG